MTKQFDEEKYRQQQERQAQIRLNKSLLEQNDYIARKVVFEIAAVLKKQFSNASMPMYEKYLKIENQANELRAEIETLQLPQ